MKKLIVLVIVLAVAAVAFWYREHCRRQELQQSVFFSGNGRLEATEIMISTKLGGRIEKVLVNEGDFVKESQPLALMQSNVLLAQMAQAKAKKHQAMTAAASADAMIAVREGEWNAAKADITQKESQFNVAQKKYERSMKLHKQNVIADQVLEEDEAQYLSSKAALEAARANSNCAEAGINAAKADAIGAQAAVEAAEADISCIQADLDDCSLLSPRDGRIQYRIAQPGEVLSAGGRVLNLVDLTDVYMTFFVPERIAGKIALGAEVRLVLDAMPNHPIPANVSYVSSVAQFTPKTVETEVERQKLMFRVKARISPDLLKQYLEMVKTGLPGVAWVKLDPTVAWPENLRISVYGTSGKPED